MKSHALWRSIFVIGTTRSETSGKKQAGEYDIQIVLLHYLIIKEKRRKKEEKKI